MKLRDSKEEVWTNAIFRRRGVVMGEYRRNKVCEKHGEFPVVSPNQRCPVCKQEKGRPRA